MLLSHIVTSFKSRRASSHALTVTIIHEQQFPLSHYRWTDALNVAETTYTKDLLRGVTIRHDAAVLQDLLLSVRSVLLDHPAS
jgi:hypothetical protein